MYINSVDTILGYLLDNSLENILKTKTFVGVLKLSNFSSKYDSIIKILNDYIKTIDWTPIKELFPDNRQSKTVIDILKKYIAYYTFISIGYFYEDNIDVYKNNIIEFSKMINKNMIDIPGFFTGESNSNIFLLVELVTGIHDVVDDEKIRQRKKIDDKYQTAIKELDELGEEFVKGFFTLSANEKDKISQCHNIIKITLLKHLYLPTDKQEILRLLETVDANIGETIYIDVSFPIEKSVDLAEIEASLTPEEIESGIAKNIFEILTVGDQTYQRYFSQTIESKILELVNSKFIIPIVEDFLLYHDDTEKYETPKNDGNKKEQLKIKYILDKINVVESLDINNVEVIKKTNELSSVHANRLAMTVNELENVKIISKLMSFGTKATEGMEAGNELINYMKYPYINFKSFKCDGFPIIFDKTIEVARSVSFNKIGIFTQSKNSVVQTRVGSDGQVLNIVGFMIPSGYRALGCLRIKDVVEIDETYEAFVNTIIDDINGKYSDEKYWYFNLKKNETQIKTYEHFDAMETSEQCKLICAKIRDDVMEAVTNRIIEILSKFSELSFYKAFKIVNYIMNMTFKIPETDPKFSEIKQHIYFKLHKKYEPQYDAKDDNMFGISGEVTYLPVIAQTKKEKILYINTAQIIKDSLQINDVLEGTICQHQISWDTIIQLKKISTVKYIEALDDFTQQFIVVTNEFDYVCKSCGTTLNIKKYITDGAYDSSTQKFIAFYIPMNVAIEEIPEYRKYNTAIRSMDKLIDQKISNILGLHFLEGRQTSQEIKRNAMIKDTIDLMLLSNSYLKKETLKVRKERSDKLYGVDGDISNIFQFELDNSIFIFTSGEKDYYKFIKHNNIVAYILFMMLLELNENQISLITDRLCNYTLYEKFGERVMGNLKIRVDNTNTVKNITEFPVLSYTLYIITCILSKYSIWYVKDEEDTKKKISPLKQKFMIYTIVDIINNTLEYADKYPGKRILEVIRAKFYMKLTSTYSNNAFFETIKENSIITTKNKEYVESSDKSIVLKINDVYVPMGSDYIEYTKYINGKYYPRAVKSEYQNIPITNMTHCKGGTVHLFALENNTRIKCTQCNLFLDEMEYDDAMTESIRVSIEYRQLEKLGNVFCLSGTRHHYVRDLKTNIKQCIKCKYVFNDYFPIEKLKLLKKELFTPKIKKDIVVADTKKEKHLNYVSNVMKTLRGSYIESKSHKDDYYKFIDTFISTIQQEVGDVINIGENLIYLNDDIYIFNHNHLGYPLQPPVTLSERDPSISFKKNHSFFKKDVIIYESEKGGKISVFYDAQTFTLLGYKEINKDFVNNQKTENRLKIVYSIKNKLRYLGSTAKYIDIKHNDEYNNKDDKTVIGLVSCERIENIGNTIHRLVIALNSIKTQKKSGDENNSMQNELSSNKYGTSEHGLNDDDLDKIIKFDIDKYMRKLQLIQLRDDKIKIFKLWSMIVQNLHYFKKNDENIKMERKDYLVFDDVINNDYAGNLLLFYLVSEMTKLFSINHNKYVRKTLFEFIVEFIIFEFNEYNLDYVSSNNELKRFECMLESSDYLNDLEKNGYADAFIEAFVEEKTKEEIEEEEDDREARDAMDMDGNVDNEDEYENGYLERDFRWYDDVDEQSFELN